MQATEWSGAAAAQAPERVLAEAEVKSGLRGSEEGRGFARLPRAKSGIIHGACPSDGGAGCTALDGL